MSFLIPSIYFFIWNFGIGRFLVETVSKICREGVNRENRAEICCRIIFPHQWVGIFIPLLFVSWASSFHEKIAIITMVIVIPYSFWTIVQITQCFSSSCSRGIPNEQETRIIYKKVVQGESSRLQSHHDNCSFRSKHPKSDIVVNTREKCKETSQFNICVKDELSQRNTKRGQHIFEESLFPIAPLVVGDRNKEHDSTFLEEPCPWDKKRPRR